MNTYSSGPYTSARLMRDMRAIEDWVMNEFTQRGAIVDLAVQRDMARRVEEVSLGRNTAMFDDQGNPSIMVRFGAKLLSDLVSGWPDDLHPAFVVNGAAKSELWVGKYQAITVGAGATERALSLRRKDPRALVTFDQALTACKQKGAGWHLMSNAEYAFLALMAKASGFWPRGNNNYGKDIARADERGEVSYTFVSAPTTYEGRVATGTGPASWSHDGSPFGVFDLNGNVWEWVGGLRLVDGEIQVLADNNAADNTKPQDAASAEWKAIMQDGSLVAPGTLDTLKWDSPNPLTNDVITQNQGAPVLRTALVNGADPVWNWGATYNDYNQAAFESATAAAGVTVPSRLRQLAAFPVDTNHGGDALYLRNYGERLAARGGYWGYAGVAGVFALNLGYLRSGSGYDIGFRPAFVL